MFDAITSKCSTGIFFHLFWNCSGFSFKKKTILDLQAFGEYVVVEFMDLPWILVFKRFHKTMGPLKKSHHFKWSTSYFQKYLDKLNIIVNIVIFFNTAIKTPQLDWSLERISRSRVSSLQMLFFRTSLQSASAVCGLFCLWFLSSATKKLTFLDCGWWQRCLYVTFIWTWAEYNQVHLRIHPATFVSI